MDKKFLEYVLLGVCTALAIFFVINFNERIGLIYGMISLLALSWYYFMIDKNIGDRIPIENNDNKRLIDILTAIGAYVVFILVAGIVTANVSGMSVFDNVNSLVGKSMSAQPILEGSNTLKLSIWGVIIPRVETTFFFVIFPIIILSALGTSISRLSWKGKSLLTVAFAGAFMAYHAQAKGITDSNSLLTTLIFGIVSLVLIIWRREQIQAIFLHIITNTIATMQTLNLGFYSAGTFTFNVSGVLILTALITLTWFLLFFDVPFGRKISMAVRG